MKRSLVLVACLFCLIVLPAGCRQSGPGQNAAAPVASSPSAKETGPDSGLVVAVVAGEKITMGDLNKTVKAQLSALDRQRLEQEQKIREDGLQQMVAKKLLTAEAARRKVTEDALLKAEVEEKVSPPTEAEIKSFYDRNAQQIGAPFEQVKARLPMYALREKQHNMFMGFLDRLRAEAKVEVTLPPPEYPVVNVAAVGPSKGPAKAPVAIVLFSDFQCPFCSRVKPMLDQVLQTYGDKVRLVFRDFPLPFHQQARKAAEASHCAEEQGKFWEMHDQMFAHQDKLAPADLKAAARQLGMDGAKFDACLDGGQMAQKVLENVTAGEEAGVQGTPTFFINGRQLSASSFEGFKQLIDRELQRTGA